MINVSIPQIPVERGGSISFHSKFYLFLPTSLQFGNLNLKNMDYSQRHDFVNEIIRNIFLDFEMDRKEETDQYFTLDSRFFKIRNETETVIYWLRKTADDLIALTYYMDYFVKNRHEPSKLSIDCIGALLNCKTEFQALFTPHLNFLGRLNNVSNTYKHSFLHSDIMSLIGKDEPTVVALNLKYNNTQNQPQYYSYSLREMVTSYSNFLTQTLELLKTYSESFLMPGFLSPNETE